MKNKNKPFFSRTNNQNEIILAEPISLKKFWIAIASLFVVAFLLYANTIQHGYVLDDVAVITKNKFVQQGVAGIPELFKTGFYSGYFGYNNNLYRPLPLVTFAIGQSLWGNNSHPDHLVNVLFYAIACCILFYMLLQLFGKHRWLLAYIITLLFITHPIHTEVVANIKSRDEILAFIFCCLSLIFCFRYIVNKSLFALLFGGLALFLGMLSKESAIAFMVIIPLAIYYFGEINYGEKIKFWKDRNFIAVVLTLMVAVSFYFSIRYALFYNDAKTVTQVLPVDNVMSGVSFFERFPTAILVLGRYLLLLIWPYPLVFDYSFKTIAIVGWGDVTAWLSFIIISALKIFGLVMLPKKNYISFGIFFFLISIFIVSNIIVTIGSGMAERFLFTPALGYCIVIGVLLMQQKKSAEFIFNAKQFQKFLFSILMVILSLFSYQTVTRNLAWKNQITLFSTDVKNAPKSARAHYSLGNQLIEDAKLEKDLAIRRDLFVKAESELKRTLFIFPDYAEAIISLGNLYQEQGDYAKAQEYLGKVSTSGIGDSGSSQEQLLYNKANALLGLKDYNGAISYYQMAIAVNPKMVESYINMGIAYKEQNLFQDAIKSLETGLEINPKSSEAYLNLGTCYSAINDYKKAALNFNKALEIKSDFAEAYVNLGDLYNRSNKLAEAEVAFKKALDLNPSIPEANFNLGYCYLLKKDYNSAITWMKKAVELRPAYLDALVNLSFCESKVGHYQEVIDYAEQALKLRPDVPDLYYNIAYGFDQQGNKVKAMEYKLKGDNAKAMKK